MLLKAIKNISLKKKKKKLVLNDAGRKQFVRNQEKDHKFLVHHIA